MYDGMDIRTESDCVLAREFTNPCELIGKLFNQVISGFDGLGCCVGCSRLDCCCCGSRYRAWRFGVRLDNCDGTAHLYNC